MKKEMSVQHSDSLTCVIVGMTAVYVKFVNTIQLNIGIFSSEFMSMILRAGITAGMAGAMGYVGKKIGEFVITSVTEYIQARKNKKSKR
jgi:hypothetical protein